MFLISRILKIKLTQLISQFIFIMRNLSIFISCVIIKKQFIFFLLINLNYSCCCNIFLYLFVPGLLLELVAVVDVAAAVAKFDFRPPDVPAAEV